MRGVGVIVENIIWGPNIEIENSTYDGAAEVFAVRKKCNFGINTLLEK